jgi:prevent-host-death family protein
MSTNAWKLQDAKAQFSELVRRARAGEPQRVTVHGKEVVVVVDPTRFDLSPKELSPQESRPRERTMAGLIERSRKYAGDVPVEFDRSVYMTFPKRRLAKRRKNRRDAS